MQQQEKGTVILFPGTVDYYQVQLTKLLENERYQEAIELLHFLLSCQMDDKKTVEEWDLLLRWLLTQFSTEPEKGSSTETNASDDEASNESEMLKNHVMERAEIDHEYVSKLIKILTDSNTLHKQLLALEQLAYIDDDNIDSVIVQWLRRQHLHPLVQFKGLQTLKSREYEEPVYIYKHGEKLKVDIEDVPSSFHDYPRPIQEILNNVQQTCEVHEPSLSYFVDHLWKEWLAFVFGTSIYHELHKIQEEDIPFWCAALHATAVQWMTGDRRDEEIMAYYGVLQEEQAKVQSLCQMIQTTFPDTIY